VPTAKEARKSVIWAMGIIGGFYVLTIFLGWDRQSTWAPRRSRPLTPAATMAAPLLAQYVGGRRGFDAWQPLPRFRRRSCLCNHRCVVAGLVLAAASAMAHDLWVGVIAASRT
jgi:cation/acetate symporter